MATAAVSSQIKSDCSQRTKLKENSTHLDTKHTQHTTHSAACTAWSRIEIVIPKAREGRCKEQELGKSTDADLFCLSDYDIPTQVALAIGVPVLIYADDLRVIRGSASGTGATCAWCAGLLVHRSGRPNPAVVTYVCTLCLGDAKNESGHSFPTTDRIALRGGRQRIKGRSLLRIKATQQLWCDLRSKPCTIIAVKD